jgi:hypothetical protein
VISTGVLGTGVLGTGVLGTGVAGVAAGVDATGVALDSGDVVAVPVTGCRSSVPPATTTMITAASATPSGTMTRAVAIRAHSPAGPDAGSASGAARVSRSKGSWSGGFVVIGGLLLWSVAATS